MAKTELVKSETTLRYEKKKEQAIAAYNKSLQKDKEKLRKEQTHKKCVMGGIIVKYQPDCYDFDEAQLNEILSVALATKECQQVIEKIKEENAGNGSWNNDDPEGGDDEE